MAQIIEGSLADSEFCARYAEPMFRQRYRVFHERLGWDVNVSDGMEHDEFDDADTRYLLLTDDADSLVGGWRLRPTTRPYMLAQVFPQLLNGSPAPNHERIWEISRFAMDDTNPRTARFGFNEAARALMAGTAQFALDYGITQYVMVASASTERLYRNLGLAVHRFGPPQRVGCVSTVAGWLDVDAYNCHVLLGHPLPLPVAA
ncbi:MAG: GNAT family N-acetyltransferase [Nevskiales bacterium]|nr:GNAT family N-acetyltransferase [Nevskiales bacterium]